MKDKFSEIIDKYIVEEVQPVLPKLSTNKLKLPKLKRLEA